MVPQVTCEIHVGAHRPGRPEQGIARAAAQCHATDLGSRVAGRADAPRGGGQSLSDQFGEPRQCHGLVELAHAPEPGVLRAGPGAGVVDQHIHGGNLIRMPGDHGSSHLTPQFGRRHELDANLGDLFRLADRTDRGVGAVAGPKPAGAGHGEGTLGVATHPAGPGGEHRPQERVDVVLRHRDDPPIHGAVAAGHQRPPWGETERLSQRVVDAGTRRVGVRVRREQGTTANDEAVQQPPLGGVGGHRVHPLHQRRVVHHEQVGTLCQRVIDDRVGGVDGHHDPPHRRSAVPRHQTDAVPRLGQPGRISLLE